VAGFQPYLVYTPLRTTDNQGGFTESLLAGSGRLIWGVVGVHDNTTSITVDARETVTPDDIILIDNAQYRVQRVNRLLAEQLKTATIDRVARPIEPL